MFWGFDIVAVGQVLLAFLLGGLIGFEREHHNSPAGIRTYAAVCLGSCVFGIASLHPYGFSHHYSLYDPTRIAAQVASGVGFLGAGVIFKEGFNTIGLTTAATIWASSAIGIVISFSMYSVAIVTTIFVILLLALPNIPILRFVSRKKAVKRKAE